MSNAFSHGIRAMTTIDGVIERTALPHVAGLGRRGMRDSVAVGAASATFSHIRCEVSQPLTRAVLYRSCVSRFRRRTIAGRERTARERTPGSYQVTSLLSRPARLAMTTTNSPASIGLVTCAWKPDVNARIRSSFLAYAVSATAGIPPPRSGPDALNFPISV